MGNIKDVVDLASDLANRVKDRKIADELNKIQQLLLSIQSEQAELHESNVKLREERLALNERIQGLEAEVLKFKSEQDLAERVFWEDGAYWLEPEGKRKGHGGYCSRCWEADKKLISLKIMSSGDRYCHNCKAGFDPIGGVSRVQPERVHSDWDPLG